jgi:preprotein translocase subunit SecA
MVFSFLTDMARNLGQEYFPNGKLRRNDKGIAELSMSEFKNSIATTIQYMPDITEKDIQPFNHEGVEKLIMRVAEERYTTKEKDYGGEMMRHLEKMILLTTIDQNWKDHLLAMDHLRDGVGLQGYGQKDPIIVYKKEAFKFFGMMMEQITGDCVRKLFAVQLAPSESADDIEAEIEREELALTGGGNFQYNLTEDGELAPTPQAKLPVDRPQQAPLDLSHLQKKPRNVQLSRGPLPGMAPAEAAGSPFAGGGGFGGSAPAGGQYGGDVAKAGRNDPCPCGSGKKYKKCHGANS